MAQQESTRKVRIVLHKNELQQYLIIPGTYLLGSEKMVRWVDIPEFIEVEGVEKGLSDYARGYQLGYLKAQEDAKTQIKLQHAENKEVT